MDQSPTPNPPLIPYAQASLAQLAQALVAAKEVLGPYYPTIAWPRWHQAFEHLQPVLQAKTDQVSLTTEGLVRLAYYFERQFVTPDLPTTQLPPPVAPAATPISAPAASTANWPKRTYSLHPEVLQLIERVSYWQRAGKSALVNKAITELLAGCAEAQQPIPPNAGILT